MDKHMVRYIAKRTLSSLGTLLLVLLFVFVAARMTGNPFEVMYPDGMEPGQLEQYNEQYGLDKSVPVQFAVYMKGVLQGDFGISLVEKRPVTEIFFEKAIETLKLGSGAFVLSVTLGVLGGIFLATQQDNLVAKAINHLISAVYAIPGFVMALLLIMIFGYYLGLLPTIGGETAKHYVLPTICLSVGPIISITRHVCNGIKSTLSQDYIQTAVAKGVGRKQVIIGHAVKDVYRAICETYGFGDATAASETPQPGAEKKKLTFGGVINAILNGISGSLSPSIPALIGCGMIQVLLIIASSLGMDTTSGTYLLLYYVGQAGFYFLPVIVCGNAAKKFGANQGLGMVIGGMLIFPDFIAAVGNGLDFLGIPVYNATYTSTIFPAILCAWVMAPIEKFFAKHSPTMLRSILEPVCTLLIMVPLAYCLLAPAGAFLGNYISSAVIWLYNTLGFVGVAVLAAVMPFLIMTGMHSAFVPYLLQMFATVGYEPIFFTALVISNIDQGISSLAVALKTKNKNLK